jgi:hypothetical protein
MKFEYVVQDPDKAHALRVGLRYEGAVDGKDEIHEVPVRKSHYESLSTTKRLAYVKECAEFHMVGPTHPKAQNRRAAWDADDKAKADAAALAAKTAEEAKFIVTPHGIKDGLVAVTIVHHGLTFSGTVAKGVDKTEFEANCRTKFAEYETAVQAEKDELAALAINA